MKKICRFCEAIFYIDPKNFEEVGICIDCVNAIKSRLMVDKDFMNEVLKELKKNPDIKYEFLESAMGDENVLKKIGKALMSVQVKDIGLGGSGTLAEFFR
jgi:hypothetical protein